MSQPVPCKAYYTNTELFFKELKSSTNRQRAWACLYEYGKKRILPRICKKLKNLREGIEEANDILAEQMGKLANEIKQGKFDDPDKRGAKFTTILYRQCRSAAIDEFRRVQRRPPTMDIDSISDLLAHPEGDDKEDRIARLRQVITTLSPREQEVFDLMINQELPSAEIATLMGITVDGVYNLKAQAMKKLRGLLR